jgi:two-component system cell cycle sensor histidine kinase/response regulator CckA
MEFTASSLTTTEATETSENTASNGQPVRVLAIDDSGDFLTLLKSLLEPQGFEVRTYTNPVKALEMFQREKNKYQLVLLDYYMPQLDGAKTFEWLRKLNPNVKVIVCSGAEELRLRQMQAQHPIDGYIHKPFRVQEALAIIRRIMGRQALATV